MHFVVVVGEAAVNMSAKESVMFIEGMTCQSCVRHIESVMTQRAGVKLVRVNLELKFAYVCYDCALTSPTELASVVDDIGFEALLDDCDTLSAVWINVSGITCQSCVQHIDAMVRGVMGVRSVHVSLSSSVATVVFNSMQTSASSLSGVINDIGFDAYLQPLLTFENSGPNIDNEAELVMIELGDEFTELAATRTSSGQQTCVISVEGMTCISCVKNIESTLSSVSGIISVEVSLDQKKADVVFNPLEISPEIVVEKIDSMGFEAAVLCDISQAHHAPATLEHRQSCKADDITSAGSVSQITAELYVTGMHCQSCVHAIEGCLNDTVGVVSVKVTLENESCRIVYDPSCVTAETLRQAVENAGDFKASFSGMFLCLFVSDTVMLSVLSCVSDCVPHNTIQILLSSPDVPTVLWKLVVYSF